MELKKKKKNSVPQFLGNQMNIITVAKISPGQ